MRAWREWLLLAAALGALTGLAYAMQLAWRFDLALYDAALSLWRRPAPADVVIVAIDDASLARLGRWPWPRVLQARLLERIAAAHPSVIALDVIYAEPDAEPANDAVLAATIARSGRVVLAAIGEDARGMRRYSAPLPALAAAAHSVGHVHVDLDPDAVVRGVYLAEGPTNPDTPHLAAAVLAAAGQAADPLPGLRRSRPDAKAGWWQRDHWYRIPFSGAPGHFDRVSAADLLEGRVAADWLRGKLVFVGATATGVGDGYAVPTSGASSLMPGVEISAQILDGVRSRIDLRELPMPLGLVVAVAPVWLTLLAYLRLAPRASLLFTAGVAAAVAALALLAPPLFQVWFPPSATFAALALCYPLWSWRRLDSSLRYLRAELQLLQSEPEILPFFETPRARSGDSGFDPVERTIAAAREAASRVRGLRRFVADSLDRQADGILVCDTDGRIALANRRCAQLIGTPSASLIGSDLRSLLHRLGVSVQFPPARADGSKAHPVIQLEANSGGRDMLVSLADCHGAGGGIIGYIVNVTDISALKAADRAREDAMNFLSHDLRAPQAAILAALELHRTDAAALDGAALLEQIERCTRRTLALAEAFVTLTRADHVDPRAFDSVDLAAIAREMVDEIWPLANARSMSIDLAIDPEEALVTGDRALLAAAIANLLSNAIRYGKAGSPIGVALRSEGLGWALSVSDCGPGIPEHARSKLFRRYARLGAHAPHHAEGIGLGLVIVSAVASKHGGRIEVASSPGSGATFTLWLPAAHEPMVGSGAAAH